LGLTATLVASDPTRAAEFIAEDGEITGAIAGGNAEKAMSLIDTHLLGGHEAGAATASLNQPPGGRDREKATDLKSA
jgi:hypothetical protein